MVFTRKRRFISRGRFRRVNYRRGRRSYLRRTKGFIKGVVRRMSEIKFGSQHFTIGTGDISNYFSLEITPTISQGVTKFQRIGNKIRYKFLQIRWWGLFFPYTGAGAVAPQNAFVFRIVVFWARVVFSVPTAPSLAEVFIHSSSGGQAALSGFNNQNVRPIYDRTFLASPSVNGTATTPTQGYASSGLPTTWYKKIKMRTNQNVSYKTTTDTLPTDPQDRLYIMCVSNVGTTNSVNYIQDLNCRLSFTDV